MACTTPDFGGFTPESSQDLAAKIKKSQDCQIQSMIQESLVIDSISTQVKNKEPKKNNIKAKEDKKLEKEAKRLEKEAKRLEKERLKLEKQQERLSKNAGKPGECTKYMIAYIDRHLLELPFASEIISKLSSNSIQYKVIDQAVPFSISIYRQNPITLEEVHEDESLVIVPSEEFVLLVYNYIHGLTQATICSKCQFWKSILGQNLTLIICGLDDYYKEKKILDKRNFRQNVVGEESSTKGRKRKLQTNNSNFCNMEVTRVDVETALVATQVEENVNHRLISSPEKVADFITQVIKSIAEKPYKQEKMSVQFDWYVEGSNSNCVKVDKSGVGLLKLWHQQLRQFNNVGIEVAQAIAKEYPSPQLLWKAYDKLPREKGLVLLADIPVRRGTGILANTRRIGPELSKKVYTFMTSRELSQNLSQN